MSKAPYIYIDNQLDWLECLDDLKQQSQIAIDLESNSLYVYKEHVCLIQISTKETDYIVDPLSDIHLKGLGEILLDESVEKIFHACEYDLILLKREYDWNVVHIFDTMWAARILGIPKIGLANLLKTHFDVSLEKKYQTTNWGDRPLSEKQLLYAKNDTHYLFDLRDIMHEKLASGGHLEEAAEAFEMQTHVTLPNNTFSPQQFWDLHGIKYLNDEQKKIAFSLFLFREAKAEEYNKPHFKIFDNKLLLAMAQNPPTSRRKLFAIKRLANWFIHLEGENILANFVGSDEVELPKRPKRPPRPAQDILDRYDYLLQWRKHRGKARGVESDIILSKDAVWEIAKTNPFSLEALEELKPVIGAWRFKTYGEEIMGSLAEFRSKNGK